MILSELFLDMDISTGETNLSYKESECDSAHAIIKKNRYDEEFIIFKNDQKLSAPVFTLYRDGLQLFSFGKERYNVAISIPKDSIGAFQKEYNMHIINCNNSDIGVAINDDIPALCVISYSKLNGEVLYPKIKKSVQFKLTKDYIAPNVSIRSYRISEVMYDNDKTTKRTITADETEYKVPVMKTSKGFYIPKYKEEIKVTENRVLDNGVVRYSIIKEA